MFFGTPGIILTDKDSGFIGLKLPQFRNEQNITVHTFIPGHRQSLGATERGICILNPSRIEFTTEESVRTSKP